MEAVICRTILLEAAALDIERRSTIRNYAELVRSRVPKTEHPCHQTHAQSSLVLCTQNIDNQWLRRTVAEFPKVLPADEHQDCDSFQNRKIV